MSLCIILPIICFHSIIKNLIGKDITRIALPIHLNEPLSLCQVSILSCVCVCLFEVVIVQLVRNRGIALKSSSRLSWHCWHVYHPIVIVLVY